MVKRAVPPSPQGLLFKPRSNFLETQAVEVDEDGMSLSGSSNSADDQDMSNLSYVTDGAGALKHSTCVCNVYNAEFQDRIPTAISTFIMQVWAARPASMVLALLWLVSGGGPFNPRLILPFA